MYPGGTVARTGWGEQQIWPFVHFLRILSINEPLDDTGRSRIHFSLGKSAAFCSKSAILHHDYSGFIQIIWFISATLNDKISSQRVLENAEAKAALLGCPLRQGSTSADAHGPPKSRLSRKRCFLAPRLWRGEVILLDVFTASNRL